MSVTTLTFPEVAELGDRFQAVAAKVRVRKITTESEYDESIAVLDVLLDAGAVLGRFIGDYDERIVATSPV